MKCIKIFFIFTIIIIFSNSILLAKGITGKGIMAGLNFADIRGEYVNFTKNKLGFVAGGFLEYSINDKFALQPEIKFTMKGSKVEMKFHFVSEYGEVYSKTTAQLILNYLELPVLAKVKVPIENIKLILFFGTFIGINVGANSRENYIYWEKDENGDIIYQESYNINEDIKSDVNDIELGLIFGAGVNLSPFIIGFRYNLGITDIWKDSEGDSVKNSVFSLMLGYSF